MRYCGQDFPNCSAYSVFVFDRRELLTETREEEGVVFRYQRGYGVEGLEAAGQQSFVMKDEVGSSIYLLEENREIQNFYQYDAFGNAYEYDRNGNRIQKVGRYRTESGSCRTARIGYEYDQRNRLSGEREGEHVIRYRYDPAGNRLEKLEDGRRTCYTYNEKNQLVLRKEGAQQWQYRYDPQGNLLEQGNDSEQTCYRYDLLNRQCEIELPDGRVQKNHYDGEGLRVGLEEDGHLCRFVFDCGELLTETREEEGVVFRYQRGYGVEGLEAAGQQSFVMKDEVGSSVYLLGENREIQNFYRYDAFGNELERSERVANRIGYTGQQYDRVSGQYYLRARYYSPRIGRFTQEDRYRGDGLNLYAYCGNNPVRYFDPSGYNKDPNCPQTLFHYTDEAGYKGILESGEIWPSTKVKRPTDARYGDGQYFTDIAPQGLTDIELSEALYNTKNRAHKVGYYFEVDVSDLNINKGRDGVFVLRNNVSLDISDLIVSSGSTRKGN